MLFALALSAGLSGAIRVCAQQPQPTLVTVLHDLAGPPDGTNIYAPLFVGHDNVLYGASGQGGTNDSNGIGFGTIFKINRDGTGYGVLHSFSEADQAAFGFQQPGATVIQGADGALYGTTTGGTNYPYGTVFKLATDGSSYSVLHSFTNTDGDPHSLMQAGDGLLYGAGANAIFRLDTNGNNYAVLHEFASNDDDGADALGKLIKGTDGALYGTCRDGNNASVSNLYGNVFKINTDGSGYTILHTFKPDGVDGREPYAGVIQGSDGALYGTSYIGGTNDFGTVFKLNTDGTGYQLLHTFQANGADGDQPDGTLLEGLDNLLYGTTAVGGTNNAGTIFEMGLDGSGYAVVHSFGPSDGVNPIAGLAQGPASDGSGVLYGTTLYNSISNSMTIGGGAIFAVVVNPPLAITPSISQAGGSPVVIWPAWALNYELQMTTNLADTSSWTTATNYVPVTGAQLSTNPPGAFYRLIWRQQ
jgi:uncharacterized repeat protein (TIGR03803 family)